MRGIYDDLMGGMTPDDFLTPDIGVVVSMLAQSFDDMTRQNLARFITEKTAVWVKGDPELAEKIKSEKKTLEGCVRYALEQAATTVAKNIAAMPEFEFKNMPKRNIQGKQATMAGSAVGQDQVEAWAYAYYYTITKEETAIVNKKGKSVPNPGKSEKKKGGKGKTNADAGKASTAASSATEAVADDTPEQMMFGAEVNAA